MAPQRGAAAAEDQRRESGVNARIVDRLEHLQTGTGKLHNTAISTAAITAVIFNLVDRTMASLRTRCQPQRRPVRALSCLRCDGDHAPTGCLSCLPARPACRLWRLAYEPPPRHSGFLAA
jgi:hypothetical protein